MHPITPMRSPGRSALSRLSVPSCEYTFSSAFSRMAQVLSEDEVRLVGRVGQLVALVLEESRHSFGVVLVHLTAVGDEVEFGHKFLAVTLTPCLGGVKPARGERAHTVSSNTPMRRNFS